jgi:hypothetical protein
VIKGILPECGLSLQLFHALYDLLKGLQYLIDYHIVLGKIFMGFSLNLEFVRQYHPQHDQASCDSG